MINNEAVERACTEVSEYSEEQMAVEFERFFKVQPNLCEFIAELTQDSGQKIQELSLFLSYMTFKAVEETEPTVSTVSPESIEAAFRETEAWIDGINQAENPEVPSAVLSNLAADTEPHLLQYVISEINQPQEDGTQFADEQKGEVFFVLKTVISALLRNSNESTESTQQS
jgi:hypothetical protein